MTRNAIEDGPLRHRRSLPLLAIVMVALVAPASALAKKGGNPDATFIPDIAMCRPTSDADGLEILSNFYPGYWWDHTDLTVAAHVHPSATAEQRAAIADAISTWSTVLDDCFDGVVTLTDVSGQQRRAADIVIHYTPNAGGVVFAGIAICGDHKCQNVHVRTDLPKSLGVDPYPAFYLGWITMHELGHALGIGHATNLEESTDLMGYGWTQEIEPTLSQCDVEELAYVFAWAFAGTEPYQPGPGPFDCS